jgi:hypothetical protein
MGQDSIQSPHQARRKCAHCGLVNRGADEFCRRCGTALADDESSEPVPAKAEIHATTRKRGFLKRVTWVLGATSILLVIWYVSLLISADGLQADERPKVDAAIALLQADGFGRETFVLKHLTMFRRTDN